MVLPLQRSLTLRMMAGFGGLSTRTRSGEEATAGHEAGQGALWSRTIFYLDNFNFLSTRLFSEPPPSILVVITIYLLRRTDKCKKKKRERVYGDSSLVVAQYTVPYFKLRFLRNMIFEGKMGIKLISQGKICVYLLHYISFCSSLFALRNE